MKKISVFALFLSFLFFGGFRSSAQVNSYAFTQSIGTFTPISVGTVISLSGCNDDANHALVNIGFNFVYNGTSYSTVGISDNGYLKFGSFSITSYTPLTSQVNTLSPFGFDLYGCTSNGASLRYLTTGTAGNQVFTVEWSHWGFYSSGNNELSFEIKLYEATNTIEFIYDATPVPSTVQNVEVGMTGSTPADFNNRKTTNDWSTTLAGGTNSSTCSFNNLVFPVSGLTFTWNQCIGAVGGTVTATPATICETGNTNLNVTGSSGFVQWQISSGGSFSNINGAINSNYTLSGLNSGNYMIRAYVNCSGAIDSSNQVLLTVNPIPNVTVSPSANFICLGDTATLTASGAATYSILPAAINSVSPFLVNPTVNTTFNIIGTANGCSDTAVQSFVQIDSFCVWPGDANFDGAADNSDLLPIGLDYGNSGPVRQNASLLWDHQPTVNWSTFSSANDKHADTNGDGTIDANDTLAISQNFGLIHPRIENGNQNNSFPPLQLMILEDTVLNMDTVHCLILVGDTMNVVGNIYGLAYTINYDNTVVDTNTAHISYFNSTLAPTGNQVSVTKDFWLNGNIKSGISRINQINFNGNAVVGMCEVDITTDNIDGKLSTFAFQTLHMTIGNITAVDANGNDVQLQAVGDSVYIKFAYTDEDALSGKNINIILFPNPTADEINIAFKGAIANEIKIENVIGQTVYSNERPSQINTVDVSNLPNGIYLVRCSKGNKTATQKLIISK